MLDFVKKKPSLTRYDLVEMYETIPDGEDKSSYTWVVPIHLERRFKALIGKRFSYCLWHEKYLGCSIQPAGFGLGDELNLVSYEQRIQAIGYSTTICR